MNRIVRSWNRSQQRLKEKVTPATVVIDGEIRQFKESSMGDKVQAEMDPGQFNSIIRQVKTVGLEKVKMIRDVTRDTLKRVRKRVGRTQPIMGVPDGSDQVNIGSFVVWLSKLKRSDKEAINQVATIYVTTLRRIEE